MRADFNLKGLCSQMPELPAASCVELFGDIVPKIIASSRWLIHKQGLFNTENDEKDGTWGGQRHLQHPACWKPFIEIKSQQWRH